MPKKWEELTDLDNVHEQEQEMVKRYQNCFLLIETKNGNKYTCVYKGVTDHKHRFHSHIYGEIYVDRLSEINIIPSFPENGLYKVNDDFCYFYRLPHRQWKRAPSRDNSSLISLKTNLSISLSEEIFSELCGSYAFDASLLTREWAFVPVHGKQVLFYYNVPVGHVTGKDQIQITCPELWQETIDFFSRNCPKWNLSQES